MKKIDYKKELKEIYLPPVRKIAFVEVPTMKFAIIDGQGDPNISKEYQDAVQALYGLSYNLKFMVKKSEIARDYTVMPLEGLWWTDDMNDFNLHNKKIWKWSAMIMQPEFITDDMVEEARHQVMKKKGIKALEKIRFEDYKEGLVAQTMYIGPYEEEDSTIEKIHGFITEKGYQLTGKHHEIYLSDPRRTAPEKLKTVLRQPCKKSNIK